MVQSVEKGFRHTAAMLLLACGIASVCGTVYGQDQASSLLPPTVSTEEPAKRTDQTADRLTLIEEHLRTLEKRNQQLQKQYDALKTEYEKILDKVRSPLFNNDAKDTDGGGIPGGVEWGPDAPAKKSGERKEGSGSKRGSGSNGEGEEEE